MSGIVAGIAEFKGIQFKFACAEFFNVHTDSLVTHRDELDVREKFWNIWPNDIVLDVGAAFGSYTLTALAAGARGIFVIEHDSKKVDILVKSVHLNENWIDRILVVPFGLYSKHGFLKEEESKAHIFSEKPREGFFEVFNIDSILSRFHQNEPARYWMKIDVEGVELEVLKGSQSFMREYKPKVLVECHNFKVPNIENNVINFMNMQGFKLKDSIAKNNREVAWCLFESENA